MMDMKTKRYVGAAIVAVMGAALFAAFVVALGFWPALATIGASVAITALLVLAISWIVPA